MYYAQITNGVVTAVTQTHSAIEAPDMIAVDSFDTTLIGKEHKGGKVFESRAQTRKEVILARLVQIDLISDKPRARRELALAKNATKVWLQTLDDEADALRTELAGIV